mmetsp:Transcript_42429/g.83589  ORF Transcript_42429/g.83589 Transcript_42429/m.83589 type:complete len:227 (-) Transcript_42429:361-1041(-)
MSTAPTTTLSAAPSSSSSSSSSASLEEKENMEEKPLFFFFSFLFFLFFLLFLLFFVLLLVFVDDPSLSSRTRRFWWLFFASFPDDCFPLPPLAFFCVALASPRAASKIAWSSSSSRKPRYLFSAAASPDMSSKHWTCEGWSILRKHCARTRSSLTLSSTPNRSPAWRCAWASREESAPGAKQSSTGPALQAPPLLSISRRISAAVLVGRLAVRSATELAVGHSNNN